MLTRRWFRDAGPRGVGEASTTCGFSAFKQSRKHTLCTKHAYTFTSQRCATYHFLLQISEICIALQGSSRVCSAWRP